MPNYGAYISRYIIRSICPPAILFFNNFCTHKNICLPHSESRTEKRGDTRLSGRNGQKHCPALTTRAAAWYNISVIYSALNVRSDNGFQGKAYKIKDERRLSQQELADLLDVTRQTVSRWESGKSYPSIQQLANICRNSK